MRACICRSEIEVHHSIRHTVESGEPTAPLDQHMVRTHTEHSRTKEADGSGCDDGYYYVTWPQRDYIYKSLDSYARSREPVTVTMPPERP